MADYQRGSREEKDAQMLYTAKAFAPNDTMIRELLELIERKDAEIKKLKAELDRAVEALTVTRF